MAHAQSQEVVTSSLAVNGDHRERQYHGGSSNSTATSTSVVEGSTSKHHKDSIADSLSSAAEGGKQSKDVTPEDLALREDICYQIFGDVGALIRDFSCAWDHKVVMHGRMYVTERRLCFYANFFGLEAKMSLRHEDVARCNKGNSVIFIPNVIVVQDKSGKDYVFRSFWDRDECHSLLERLRTDADKAEKLQRDAGISALLYTSDSDNQQKESARDRTGSSSGSGSNRKHSDGATPAGAHAGDSVNSQQSPQGRRSNGDDTNDLIAKHGSNTSSDSSSRSNNTTSGGALKGVQDRSPPAHTKGTATAPSSPATVISEQRRGRSSSMPPSTLPASPTVVAAGRQPPSPARRGSLYSPAAAAAVAAHGGDAGRMGLAVLGGEHDIPPPFRGRSRYVADDKGDAQRHRSPRHAAVITGEGRGGWGSEEGGPSAGAAAAASVSSGDCRSASGQGGEEGAGGAVDCDETTANGATGATASSVSNGGAKPAAGGGLVGETNGSGVLRDAPDTSAEVNGRGDDSVENGDGKRKGRGGRDGAPLLKRRGSILWLWRRADGGDGRGKDGERGDPVAERKALEEAVAAAGRHSEVATAEFPVSVRDFYERFFADDAPYGLPDFHMSRGDWEVDAGEWQTTEDKCEAEQSSSNRPAAQDNDKEGSGCPWPAGLTRALRFKTPLHITFMSSPGQVRTLKRQRVRFFGSQGCVVDTITTVEDRIPLSDNFHVEDRWVIRRAGAEGRGCTATVSWRCVWHKFTVIKGLIEGKCRSDVQSFNIAFLEGMRLHLLENDKKSGSKLAGDRREGTAGALKKRRNSFRRSSGSFLRRASRDRDGSSGSTSSARKKRSTSFELDDRDSAADEVGVAGAASLAELEEGKHGGPGRGVMQWIEYLSPLGNMLSICFVLYVAAFWVRHQLRDGGDAVGRRASAAEIERLYSEWGQSSLALLSVREETRKLSSELIGRDGVRGLAAEDKSLLLLLKEVEQKVNGISTRTDETLERLSSTAAQLLDVATSGCHDAAGRVCFDEQAAPNL